MGELGSGGGGGGGRVEGMGAPKFPTGGGGGCCCCCCCGPKVAAVREDGGAGAAFVAAYWAPKRPRPMPLPRRGPGCGLPGRRSMLGCCFPAVDGRLGGSSALGMRERGRPVEMLGRMEEVEEDSGLGVLVKWLRRLLTERERRRPLPVPLPKTSPLKLGRAVNGLIGLTGLRLVSPALLLTVSCDRACLRAVCSQFTRPVGL